MTDPIPPGELAGYLAAQDAQRAAGVEAILRALTDRERQLVREAAVMGYVQGCRNTLPYGQHTIPPDSAVLAAVVGACLAMPDLYPTLGRGTGSGPAPPTT